MKASSISAVLLVFFRATLVLATIIEPQQQQQPRHLSSPSGIDLVTCTPGETNFKIQLMDMGDVKSDDRFVEAFEKAAERWEKVIVGDLADIPGSVVSDLFLGSFSKSFNGPVDDVVIGFEVSDDWDGVGGTLGQAGGTFTRPSSFASPLTTIAGIMRFDLADFERLPESDVKAIILHEMGHVLGLVGTNGDCTDACNPNVSSSRSPYQCALAAAEYEAIVPGNSLFLENSGGIGTACGHWDEAVFRTSESSELMTGFFEANLFQPLSLVTVAALDDIEGYEVDYCGADIWPADENTIQRFEVFRTQQNTDPEAMVPTGPAAAIDMNGEIQPTSDVKGVIAHLWFAASALAVVLFV